MNSFRETEQEFKIAWKSLHWNDKAGEVLEKRYISNISDNISQLADLVDTAIDNLAFSEVY